MKHRSSFVSLDLAAFTAVLAFAGAVDTAHAAPTVAMRKCEIYACDSAESAARRSARRVGKSAVRLDRVRHQRAVSAVGIRARVPRARAAFKDGCLITSGDLGAVELDNEVFARASKIAPIDIPPDVADVGEQRGVGDRRGLDLQSRNLGNDWSNRLEPVARPVRAADLALDGVLRLQDSRVQPRPYQRSDHVPLSRRVDGSGRDGRPRCCVRALLSIVAGDHSWRGRRAHGRAATAVAGIPSGCGNRSCAAMGRRIAWRGARL